MPPRRGPHGPGGGPPMEKAKDFKGTVRKLMGYVKPFKAAIIAVMIFAVGSTIFNIAGPKVLSKATTEIFNGLVSKVGGGSGIDFDKIFQVILTVMGMYVLSGSFSFIQGWLMTGVSQKMTYRMRNDISEKIHRIPMKYYESNTHGEVLSRVTNDVDTLGMSLNQSITQLITSVTTIIGGYMLPFMTCLRELSLFLLLCTQGFILSTTLDYFDEMGLYAFSSAINLILIVAILIFNTLVNKITGASLDEGIGGK